MNERFHQRRRLIDEMNRLAETVLPSRATEDHRYPVSDDHCFKRIAFDAAAGGLWSASIRRPFYRYATDEEVRTAIRILEEMADDPERAISLNRASLSYRRTS
ncbi:hypothetical protein [Longibacter sp.]|jgi:hypothetical protein|uniref:hypothetical protein n=1 Tax=Longibacter sp. TaxID=2045415 RepID=UPI003EC15106